MVGRVFLLFSHRESLCEHFLLNCGTNSALGRAQKCWLCTWRGVPAPFLLLTPTCCSCLKLAKLVCMAVRESYFLHPPRVPPTSLPYATGPRRGSLRTQWNTRSLNIPLSSFHGTDQLEGRVSKFSAHPLAQFTRKRTSGRPAKM